jgi:hypothetical protein
MSQTAPPCRICGTTKGHRVGRSTTPRRVHGLCGLCYEHEVHAGRIRVKSAPEITCPTCGTVFYAHPSHARLYCSVACVDREAAEHPEPLPDYVSPAMVGIQPGQPPTDPKLTRRRLHQIGNTNNQRALDWLQRHPALATADAYAALIWSPAKPERQSEAA